jgi:hypothetical protein
VLWLVTFEVEVTTFIFVSLVEPEILSEIEKAKAGVEGAMISADKAVVAFASKLDSMIGFETDPEV